MGSGLQGPVHPCLVPAGLPTLIRAGQGGGPPMSPMVGINPTLMTQLINSMKRVSGTIPDVSLQVERAVASLGVELYGPAHAIGRQMSEQIPSLQGRLDLILAEPDRKSGKGGVLWANESDWLSKSPAEGA